MLTLPFSKTSQPIQAILLYDHRSRQRRARVAGASGITISHRAEPIMQVNNVLVESLFWNDDRSEGTVKSILYEFGEPQWISIHAERHGHKLGPLTLLADSKNDLSKIASAQEFTERPLRAEPNKSPTLITFQEEWTILPWTAYALVLPLGFVPVEMSIKDDKGNDCGPELKIASNPLGFLFCETVFSGDKKRIADVRVRIRKDPLKFARLLKHPEILEEQRQFESLRRKLCAPEPVSADAWFKLLDVARKEIQINELGILPYQEMKAASPTPSPTPDPRKVFVVHGRNAVARKAMFEFLRAIGLNPLEWSQIVAATGKPAPYIGEVLNKGFSMAKAVVVLWTPDDEARLKEAYRKPDDPAHEAQLTGQARPNVLFEAGMAMGLHPNRTVLVELGTLRPFTDVLGRHVVKLNDSVARRQDLATRLKSVGCSVDLDGTDWHSAGSFDFEKPKTVNPPTRKWRGRSLRPQKETRSLRRKLSKHGRDQE
jgi:predicted nucleotide-binding protein